MTDYLVRLTYTSALDLPTPVQIVHPDGLKVRIQPNNTIDESGVPLEFGLEAEVFLQAAHIEQAFELAAAAADQMVSLLSVIHGCAISPPEFESAIDANPGTADRELRQKLALPRKITSKRQFNKDAFSFVLERLNTASSDNIECIIPALHWYRKGLMETVPADQFWNFWTALETLNRQLKVKHTLPVETPVRPCPNCGAPVEMVPTSAGIKFALTTLIGEQEETWRKVHRTRKGLDHAIGHMTTVQTDAVACLPILRKAVLAALFDLLGIPRDEHATLIREPLGFLREAYMVCRTTIFSFPYEKIANRATRPYFRFTLNEPPLTGITESGLRSEKMTLRIDLIGAESYKHADLQTWTFVDADLENKQAKLEVKFDGNRSSMR